MAKCVMIIDDAKAIREIVSLVLSSEGHEIIEAVDGVDALKKLDGRTIDLFICDVNMPNMDGLTFVKTVKTDNTYSAYRFTPCIMLTTESGEDMRSKGKEAGAKAWLLKPFQPNVLIDTIKKLMPA